MGDIPVAQIVNNGSSVTVYYIHTDQLNAPRKITLPSTNALAWRWDPHPFGEQTPNQNPAGLGTFVNNLRFPGQYYTYESGLNHNGYRDYDPQTGRYLESDPIGLAGGSYSTYAYAGGNPISNTDSHGLSVRVVGFGPGAQASLDAAYATLMQTPTGAMLIQALQDSPIDYLITDLYADRYRDNYLYWNNTISIDPNFHPPVMVRNSCGELEGQPAPTAVLLGHELGHAIAYPYNEGPSPDRMDNVNEFENPIRAELGLPPRVMYPVPFAYEFGR